MLTSSGLGKKSVEGIISTTDCLIRRHLTIGLDTMLEAVKLPAGVTGLHTGLT